MSNITLQEIFGDNAVQDADSITIAKADLTQNTGFTAADENDGESVLAALLFQAKALGLDTEHRDGNEEADPNITQQIAIGSVTTNLVSRVDSEGNITNFLRDSYTIDLDIPTQPVTPDNY